MVWKPSEWKQAIDQLQDKYRSVLGELFEAVASEENRLSRMEIDGRLRDTTDSSERKSFR